MNDSSVGQRAALTQIQVLQVDHPADQVTYKGIAELHKSS